MVIATATGLCRSARNKAKILAAVNRIMSGLARSAASVAGTERPLEGGGWLYTMHWMRQCSFCVLQRSWPLV